VRYNGYTVKTKRFTSARFFPGDSQEYGEQQSNPDSVHFARHLSFGSMSTTPAQQNMMIAHKRFGFNTPDRPCETTHGPTTKAPFQGL
jgi:hypothetical protein